MILWGGSTGSFFNDGVRYSQAVDCWMTMTAVGAPSRRAEHTAIWTGKEMLIWGGVGIGTYPNEVSSYTPTRLLYLFQRP